MSDDEQPPGTDVPPASAPGAHGGGPRPRPEPGTRSVSAARRARRIGGATGPAATDPSDAPTSTGASAASGSDGDAAPGAPAGSAASSTGEGEGADAATASSGRWHPARGQAGIPGWLRWLPAVLLVACAAAMAALVVVDSHGVWWSTPSSASIRDRVLASAKTCVVATNEYTYTDIAAAQKRGVACTTGAYTDNYVSAIKHIVQPAATKLKASQTVQINAAGIENVSASGNQWVIVVYGQTHITQADAAARNDPFAATVTMKHVGGKWLIASIGLITTSAS